MAFDINSFSSKVDSTMNTVKAKYAKAYKVVEITAKGKESKELENVRSQEDVRAFDD